jgi:hypothetical protein
MRSHDANISSMDSMRYQTRTGPIPTNTINQVTSTKVSEPTDTLLSTTPNDVYQQVYHDDSSTHGSRTLDSRFSRDKYDLSDGESTDEDNEDEQNLPNPSTEQVEQPVNGSSSPPSAAIDPDKVSHRIDMNQTKTSQDFIEPDEFDKGKSPGIEPVLSAHRINNETEEEEEDHSESNHTKENRVSLEIYHHKNNEYEKDNENDRARRYSASLKMYLNARNSSETSQPIHITTNINDRTDEKQVVNINDDNNNVEEEKVQEHHRHHHRHHHHQHGYEHQKCSDLQALARSASMDLTRSPSSSSSSIIEPPVMERFIGSKLNTPYAHISSNPISPPMVIEIRGKPPSLPRMTDYIEYVDRRTLPPKDSLSWQDDTIAKDQVLSVNDDELPENTIELVRQVIESILIRIVEEERQLLATVDRLVEQACSRALCLYRIERRAQLFSGSSPLLHHKSCMLRTVDTDNNDNHQQLDMTNISSRLRTKSSPVIATTTDWTDVSRMLAAQTCFAAYPSGENCHELQRSDFSTFSEAKLKFFNIISHQNDLMPSQSSVSLPLPTTVNTVMSSSSSTRSSRASSVSSYASSMHVPCPPLIEHQSKRSLRPLSARLLDLSDESDSNMSTTISTSLKTCLFPSIPSASARTVSIPAPLPPPPLRPQRRHHQPKRRSNEDLNSSSDDSLSNHLNKAAGFRSVFVSRHHHNK